MNPSPRRGGGGGGAAQRAAAGPGAAEQRGGAVPATSGVHTLQRPGPGDLWNVLALTEQRRRRAQATLGPCARPPRQAARLIGPRCARVRSSLVHVPRQSRLSPPLLLPEAPLAASARPHLPGPAFLPLSSPPPAFPRGLRGLARAGWPRGRALSV